MKQPKIQLQTESKEWTMSEMVKYRADFDYDDDLDKDFDEA